MSSQLAIKTLVRNCKWQLTTWSSEYIQCLLKPGPSGYKRPTKYLVLRLSLATTGSTMSSRRGTKRKVPDEPEILCAYCSEEVRVRQHAIQCDRPGCDRWQHRTCQTPFSAADYYLIKKGEMDVTWYCYRCPSIVNPAQEDEITQESEGFGIERAEESESEPKPLEEIDADTVVADLTVREFHIESIFPEQAADLPPVPPLVLPVLPDVAHLINQSDDGEYDIIDGCSERGGALLCDSYGYSYTEKKSAFKNSGKIQWRCSKRCGATVVQESGIFSKGREHDHAGQPGIAEKMKVRKKTFRMVKENYFKSSQSIVEEVMAEDLTPDMPFGSRANPATLARAANRHRQANRPADPTDLKFEMAADHIPEDFLQSDVKREDQRHLIFATPDQLKILAETKILFLDGTFKVVKAPFKQLFSFHTFLGNEEGNNIKQVPLTFVLMSSKKKMDYVVVFQKVKDLVPSLQVLHLILDFESSIWRAARIVFPNARIRGCSFHWSQALWRKVQELGLVVAYNSVDAVHNYIRMLFALPYLPADHIIRSFDEIAPVANDQLLPLVDYVRSTWMLGQWSPEDWCVYKRYIRTNNDVEGWHNRLNMKAQRGNLQLYLLIQLLHSEAKLVPLQKLLVTEDKLRRQQRKETIRIQGALNSLWEKYDKGEIKTSLLLTKLSAICTPKTQ